MFTTRFVMRDVPTLRCLCRKAALLHVKARQLIVGGEIAKNNAWPFFAALYSPSSFLCGGTLIDPLWVLTAAHCINYTESDMLPSGVSEKAYALTLVLDVGA
jgi:secreted trypsin-like serine protease